MRNPLQTVWNAGSDRVGGLKNMAPLALFVMLAMAAPTGWAAAPNGASGSGSQNAQTGPAVSGQGAAPSPAFTLHPQSTTPLSALEYKPVSEFKVTRYAIPYEKHRQRQPLQSSLNATPGKIYQPIPDLPGSGHDYLKDYYQGK